MDAISMLLGALNPTQVAGQPSQSQRGESFNPEELMAQQAQQQFTQAMEAGQILDAGESATMTPDERIFIDQSYQRGEQAIADLLLQRPDLLSKNGEQASTNVQTGTDPAVDRVNANTKQHGVTASRDSKTGVATLTNIRADGTPSPESQRQIYGFNPLSGTGSTSVSNLLTQLKTAKDPDTARGIAASLRTSLAEESARLESAADTFAENKLGIPRVRQMLAAAEALDSQRPGYMPGIGDSENTQNIRKQLFQMQTQARQVSADYLKTNLSSAQLRAAAENASAELQRIEKLSTKNEQVAATLQARRDDRQYERELKASEQYDSLAPSQKLILARLNPELAAKPDNHGEMVAFFQRQAKADPNFLPVMSADPAELPKLAIGGNPLARRLVVQEEAAATGRPADEIDKEIQGVMGIAKKPEAVQNWIMLKTNSVSGNKVQARKDLQAKYNTLSVDSTKAGKAEFAELQQEIAMENYKLAKTNKFLSNVTSWGIGDPDLDAAIKIATANSGDTSMTNVLSAYVGSKTGPDAMAAYSMFKEKINRAAAKQGNSVFGGVNSLAALTAVDQQALQSSGANFAEWWARRWTDPNFQKQVKQMEVLAPFQRSQSNQAPTQ